MNNSNKEKSNFCIYPFIGVSSKPNGDITPCCKNSTVLGNIKETSLEDIWNSTEFQNLRDQFIKNQRPKSCFQCWQIEDYGEKSLRQTANRIRKDYLKTLPNQTMPFDISFIELKLSNLCNFKCRTCSPEYSTTWFKDTELVKDIYLENGRDLENVKQNNFDQSHFLEDFEKIVPYVRTVDFAGGEPLMDPVHYKILDILLPYANSIEISYSTNLSNLTFGKYDTLQYWKEFKCVDICVSLDGYPELNDYIRSDSDTFLIENNIRTIKKVLGNKLTCRAALCFSVWNALFLPEIYDYFTFDLDLPIHGNIARFPEFINPQILPQDLKNKAVDKYRQYTKKIENYNISNFKKSKITKFINTNRNFLLSDDKSYYWPQFTRYSKILDGSRNTNLLKIIPEFKGFINE